MLTRIPCPEKMGLVTVGVGLRSVKLNSWGAATRGVNSIITLGGVRDFCPAKLETALRKMRYIT